MGFNMMMIMLKIFSKRGQISMEMGILIFMVIISSTIASYYYITHYLNSNPDAPGKAANNTINSLNNITKEEIKSMSP